LIVARSASSARYGRNVFINCPFDDEYLPIFRAVVFTVAACGYLPRCTLEHEDASQVRITKILRLIEDSAQSVHDVSRIELDAANQLPRFNMPLELGAFLGAKHFGNARHRRKRCLILDRERYRYQKFISDIGGQDIRSHDGKPDGAIRAVRDWLRRDVKGVLLPGGTHLCAAYDRFTNELPQLCAAAKLDAAHLTFTDFSDLLEKWLRAIR
jgi:hypothetical protein